MKKKKTAHFLEEYASTVTLSGKSRCDIDAFTALLDFSQNALRAATKDSIVTVEGHNLELGVITDESISIFGTITSVKIE